MGVHVEFTSLIFYCVRVSIRVGKLNSANFDNDPKITPRSCAKHSLILS